MPVSRPPLSVVIPHYNHGRFIRDGVGSLLAQSAPPDEVVIVDDASTDGSRAVLRELAADPRVRLVLRDKNLGVNATLVEALGHARHPWVFCMAADDLTKPGFLEKSLDQLAAHPRAGFCTALAGLISEDGRYLGRYETPCPRPDAGFLTPSAFKDAYMRHGSWVISYSVIYRRDAMLDAMRGVPPLGPTLDGFLIHTLGARWGACFIPEELVLWRRMETGYANTFSRKVDEALSLIGLYVETLRGTGLFPPAYLDKMSRLGHEEILNNLAAQTAFDREGVLKAAARLPAGPRAGLYRAALGAGGGRRATKAYLFAGLSGGEQARILGRKLSRLFGGK